MPLPATHLQPVQAIVKMGCTNCVCSGAHCVKSNMPRPYIFFYNKFYSK